MAGEPRDDPRRAAEEALGHPVAQVVPGPGSALVAASVAGDPPRARVAWLAPGGRALARVACPPGVPSRARPVVACVVEVVEANLEDRLLVARLAPEAAGLRVVLAAEGDAPEARAGPEGLAVVRLPAGAAVLAVDALSSAGEPVGRLVRGGVGEMRLAAGRISGRLGSGHGMGAGIGEGRWLDELSAAAFAAGFAPRLPAWVPPGLERSRPRLEPDVSYPAAPPALVLAWTGADAGRVLVRQAVAPLASPDPGGAGAREVPVGEARGVMRGRGLVTLVWETADLAFGVQVRRLPDPEGVALGVARSIPGP